MTAPGDTKTLIETAIRRFLEEVPALAGLKMEAALELRGRKDVQIYKVVMPGPVITKDIASQAYVRLEVNRARFNELATKGTVADWHDAFVHGDAKATGVEQYVKLIAQVVERQMERTRLRRARH